ncbi:hypothetical protein GOL32_28930 [Sinorhizobium medicae]|nr:hypothetical protein [Sinorhizobium medicae]
MTSIQQLRLPYYNMIVGIMFRTILLICTRPVLSRSTVKECVVIFKGPVSLLTCYLLLPLATLTGCGDGFQSAKPDPEQILSVRNPSFAAARMREPNEEILPLPTPMLPPPADDQFVPFEQPAKDPNPISPKGASKPSKPAALGVPTPADVTADPFTSMGRLEFMKGGRWWWCSAQFVGDTGDVLLTAGHCVYDTDTNRWNSNFVFFVGQQGANFKLALDWDCSAIYSGWAQDAYRKDYAFLRVRGQNDKALGLRVGLPGVSWQSMGYPGNFGGGTVPHVVSGSRGRVQLSGVVEMTGNPFGGGSSGGAWFIGDYAIGLNSFGYDNMPTSMWGPIFDGQTTKLYEYVRRGCQGDVIPLGESPEVAAFREDKALIAADVTQIDYGPRVEKRSSASCLCDRAEEIVLSNKSEWAYLSEVDYRSSLSDGTLLAADHLKMKSGAASDESLGCSLGNEKGEFCEVGNEFRLVSAKREVPVGQLAVSNVLSGFVDAEFCADQCLNNPNGGYCLPFGSAAKPIVLPMAAFLTDSLDRTPQADGTTTTIEELVKALGGDPKKVEDPCGRSDFYRIADNVKNDGSPCITTSPPVTDLPGESRVALRSPPAGSATRTVSSGALGSAAQFSTRIGSPAVEFYGKAATELNKNFGGFVTNIERRSSKLIITTEHGCSMGDDQ